LIISGTAFEILDADEEIIILSATDIDEGMTGCQICPDTSRHQCIVGRVKAMAANQVVLPKTAVQTVIASVAP
jgi:N-acetylglucosamine kinase-like BadF-type ATPase